MTMSARADSLETLRRYPGHMGLVESLTWPSDGYLMASDRFDQTAQVW
jgi:hypothetical protein